MIRGFQETYSCVRVPEECPADVEAMIARCLDNDPDNRPSAREMVDFMVELPATLSREDSSGATPSVDAPSSGVRLSTHSVPLLPCSVEHFL